MNTTNLLFNQYSLTDKDHHILEGNPMILQIEMIHIILDQENQAMTVSIKMIVLNIAKDHTEIVEEEVPLSIHHHLDNKHWIVDLTMWRVDFTLQDHPPVQNRVQDQDHFLIVILTHQILQVIDRILPILNLLPLQIIVWVVTVMMIESENNFADYLSLI